MDQSKNETGRGIKADTLQFNMLLLAAKKPHAALAWISANAKVLDKTQIETALEKLAIGDEADKIRNAFALDEFCIGLRRKENLTEMEKAALSARDRMNLMLGICDQQARMQAAAKLRQHTKKIRSEIKFKTRRENRMLKREYRLSC